MRLAHARSISPLAGRIDFPYHRAKIYHSLVIRGKLRSSFHWITKREKGRVFHPEYMYPKTGQLVLEVLRSKHPLACPSTARSLEAYGVKPLTMVPLDITDETMATVVRRLAGSAGPGGVDSISLKN